MRKNQQNQFSIQFVLILLLFLLIVVLSSMIVILGKDIYTNIIDDRESNYNLRVSLSYITNKIRQGDKENSVFLDSINDNQALVIRENYDGLNYDTWIYYYDGYIYEILVEEGQEFFEEDGMKIIYVEDFNISKENENLYKFYVKNDNKYVDLYININSKEEVYDEE